MAGRITQETIDAVTRTTDIVSLVGEYVPLTQKGNNWWRLLPQRKGITSS